MCYRVDCNKCGKYSWDGCGKHLSKLYASIDEGKRCMCRPWPGVITTTIPSANNAANTNQAPAATQAPSI
ncbi:hypothetical protein F3Y22_tig00113124pilonHSYRG00238 [Hibiscus syriacus]|uniref:Uncharacterized protein n=1 Tax=Hibiscus syriacus TaxID=106335 RepID=A0A6A2WQ47_HIBSY|nr:hypothetical protein F3Y22_tig00113124pilonHSYRG00238 [Hibiscus syriacus]